MKYLLLTLLLFLVPHAHAGECTLYEKSHPIFVGTYPLGLDGAHLSTGKCTLCASCHVAGKFMGTPNTCYLCHAVRAVGSSAVQWSVKHIPTYTVTCGGYGTGCHNTTSFTVSHQMNHTSVAIYRCDSCHSPNTISCQYASYNANCQPKDHPKAGTVNGVKNTPLLGVDCGSSGCHRTTTFSM
jgi:hypothetical protein